MKINVEELTRLESQGNPP